MACCRSIVRALSCTAELINSTTDSNLGPSHHHHHHHTHTHTYAHTHTHTHTHRVVPRTCSSATGGRTHRKACTGPGNGRKGLCVENSEVLLGQEGQVWFPGGSILLPHMEEYQSEGLWHARAHCLELRGKVVWVFALWIWPWLCDSFEP